jgi:hypothetical protein
MDRTPAYFIGGTFGGTSAGWMIAIIAATLTAFFTFIVGLAIEDYRRHRDRKAVAGAVRAEIAASMQLIEQWKLEARYSEIRDRLQDAHRREQDVPGFPDDTLTFPVTIYEKCADRVGTLGKQEAEDVVWFYSSFLHVIRTAVPIGLNGELGVKFRASNLSILVDMLRSGSPKAKGLLVKLQAVEDQPWCSMFANPVPGRTRGRWAV